MVMPARRSARFGVRFGKHGGCNPKFQKSVTILLLSLEAVSTHQGVENPCVGGSIPPQATSQKSLNIIDI
jgi:hypothetical protein